MVAHTTPQHTPRRQIAYAIGAKMAGDGGTHREQIVRGLASALGDADSATRQRAINALCESLADQVEQALEGYNDEPAALLAVHNDAIAVWIATAIQAAVAAARCP
jgi:hypothetical protein